MTEITKRGAPVAGRLWRRIAVNDAADESGQAMIELAVSMLIYTLLIVGAAEFARLEYAGIEVANAARAGAAYGAQNHFTEANTASMKAIAQADAANLTTLTATATTLCKCTNGVAITCANASTACTARVVTYVQVNTSATINPLFHLPTLPSTFTLTGQAIMRVVQ